MGKEGNHLQFFQHEIEELQDYKHELNNWFIYIGNQINMKDQLIETLKIKLIQ